ncbi:MAG: hypothetical protein ACOCT0_02875 [Halobacteriota archaeon]
MVEPGTALIFGIVLAPLYAMLAGWVFGEPRDFKLTALGLALLVGIATALWGGLFVLSMLIWLVFF